MHSRNRQMVTGRTDRDPILVNAWAAPDASGRSEDWDDLYGEAERLVANYLQDGLPAVDPDKVSKKTKRPPVFPPSFYAWRMSVNDKRLRLMVELVWLDRAELTPGRVQYRKQLVTALTRADGYSKATAAAKRKLVVAAREAKAAGVSDRAIVGIVTSCLG